MPSITQNRMRLARMNGQQALAAVMKPGGRLVSQEVAESIVRFIAGGSELRNAKVEPSLLSLICRELNDARIVQNAPRFPRTFSPVRTARSSPSSTSAPLPTSRPPFAR